MNAEEQLNKLKQIPPLSKEEKRKKIVTSIVLSVATLLSVLFLIFAFIQKQEADTLRLEAETHRKMAEQARIEAEHQRLLATYASAQAQQQLQQALAELENCRKGKR